MPSLSLILDPLFEIDHVDSATFDDQDRVFLASVTLDNKTTLAGNYHTCHQSVLHQHHLNAGVLRLLYEGCTVAVLDLHLSLLLMSLLKNRGHLCNKKATLQAALHMYREYRPILGIEHSMRHAWRPGVTSQHVQRVIRALDLDFNKLLLHRARLLPVVDLVEWILDLRSQLLQLQRLLRPRLPHAWWCACVIVS